MRTGRRADVCHTSLQGLGCRGYGRMPYVPTCRCRCTSSGDTLDRPGQCAHGRKRDTVHAVYSTSFKVNL